MAKNNIAFKSKGRDLELKSLNRYSLMNMAFPHGNLFNRMEWLQEAFLNIALFPVGKNRGFFEQMASNARNGDPMRIFNSCKIPAGTLNVSNCLQFMRDGEVYVLLPLPRRSQSKYLAFTGKHDEDKHTLHVDCKMYMDNVEEELGRVTFDLC